MRHLVRLSVAIPLIWVTACAAAQAQNQYPAFTMEKYQVVLSANQRGLQDDPAARQGDRYVYELIGQDFVSDERLEGIDLPTVGDGYDPERPAYATPWQTLTAWQHAIRTGDLQGFQRCYGPGAAPGMDSATFAARSEKLKRITVSRAFQYEYGLLVIVQMHASDITMAEPMMMKNIKGSYLITSLSQRAWEPRILNVMAASSLLGPLKYERPTNFRIDRETVYKYGFGESVVDGKPSSFTLTADLRAGKLLIVFAVLRNRETGKRSIEKYGSFLADGPYDFDESPDRIQLHFDTDELPTTVESIAAVECNHMVVDYDAKMTEFLERTPLRIVDYEPEQARAPRSLEGGRSVAVELSPTTPAEHGVASALPETTLAEASQHDADLAKVHDGTVIVKDTFSRTALLSRSVRHG